MMELSSVLAGRTEVVHLSLAPARRGPVVAFAALSDGDGPVRVFFNQAARADGLSQPDGETGFVLDQFIALRGNAGLQVVGRLSGRNTPKSVTFALPCEGATLILRLSTPRLDILAGQDCLLSTLNQALSLPVDEKDPARNPTADPAYIHDWLAHHMRYQGASAALLLNRLGPNGEGADFADRLGAALASPIKGLQKVIVLDVPGPSGRLGEGDERHLIYAPDAPGKPRMEPPPPDPWRAAFGDEILLEFVRYAFLERANGVAYLDLSDWIAPPQAKAGTGADTVYEAARAARPDPLIALTGQRAFPWKLPNHGAAVPGDHICRPFDLKASFGRWVYSPAQGRETSQVWRPHRIIGLGAHAATGQQLWRYVGMRHPGAAPAQMVPKSSLREHPDLLALSRDVFGHDPFRVPAPDINKGTTAPRDARIVLVTCMKNEGPFLLEWIAYHRAIGVSDFIVFTNDCTDGTDTFLDLLAARGIVEHYPNPFREMQLKPQHAGFRAAEKMQTVKDADWLMTLDVDEFINVHVGAGHLRDLFAAVGDANMISCTWRLFGNSDLSGYADDFLLRQFTQCAAQSASRPHQAWGFKTLYQNNGIFRKLGVHRPKGLQGAAVDRINWVNGSGQPMPEKEYRSAWRSSTDTIGYDLVSLNHYAVRSTESFLVKRDRGRVNHVDRDQGEAYWFRMNHNTTGDRSILRMLPALEAEWETLMADPEIRTAHAYSVARHRAKIEELLAQPAYRQFYDRLTSPRYRSLSRMLPAFGSHVFLTGPESVPQELVDDFSDGALPEKFFFTVDAPSDVQH